MLPTLPAKDTELAPPPATTVALPAAAEKVRPPSPARTDWLPAPPPVTVSGAVSCTATAAAPVTSTAPVVPAGTMT